MLGLDGCDGVEVRVMHRLGSAGHARVFFAEPARGERLQALQLVVPERARVLGGALFAALRAGLRRGDAVCGRRLRAGVGPAHVP